VPAADAVTSDIAKHRPRNDPGLYGPELFSEPCRWWRVCPRPRLRLAFWELFHAKTFELA